MSFTLHPALPEDISTLMRLQFAAFLDPFRYEPYHEVLYPGGNTPSAIAAASVRVTADLLHESGAHFFKILDPTGTRIVGGCKWLDVPDNSGPPAPVVADWFPDEERRGHAEAVLDGLYAARKKWTRDDPYICLEMLYVDKEFQGKGAGRCAMEWGVKRAEERGWQAVLESTRWARVLYEKFGFVAVEHKLLEVPERWAYKTPVQYFVMYRPRAGETVVEAEDKGWVPRR